MEGLQKRLDEILAIEEPAVRVEELESLITVCAAPLEDGEELSEDYGMLLTTLGRLHMVETARLRLIALIA